jgi:hypothetical protein
VLEHPDRANQDVYEGDGMATRKNTHNSTRRAAQKEGAAARADFNKFVAEHQDDEDLADGGALALMTWIVALVKDEEREQQPQVDAAIQYLDPSISV